MLLKRTAPLGLCPGISLSRSSPGERPPHGLRLGVQRRLRRRVPRGGEPPHRQTPPAAAARAPPRPARCWTAATWGGPVCSVNADDCPTESVYVNVGFIVLLSTIPAQDVLFVEAHTRFVDGHAVYAATSGQTAVIANP